MTRGVLYSEQNRLVCVKGSLGRMLLVRDFFHFQTSSRDLLFLKMLCWSNRVRWDVLAVIIPRVYLASMLDTSRSQQGAVTCLTHCRALRPLSAHVRYYEIMTRERTCLYFVHIKWHLEVIYTLVWEKKGVSRLCCYMSRKNKKNLEVYLGNVNIYLHFPHSLMTMTLW